MQKQMTFTLTAVGAAALLMSACTSGGTTDSSGSEELDTESDVTLTVQQQTGHEGIFSYVAEEFEKANPNVSVELETISQEQKVGSNLTVLGSSEPPDVGMIPINSEVYTQLVNGNALAPLDDVWADADLDSRYDEAVGAALQVDGTPYALSFTQVIYGVIWLNPDVLADVGLEVPANNRFESVNQLVEYADKLRAGGYGPLQLGGGGVGQLGWMVDSFFFTSASPEQMENYLTSYDSSVDITAHYTDPAFVDVLETLEVLANEGVFQDGFLGQEPDAALAPFLAGSAGMAIGGSWHPSLSFTTDAIDFTPDYALLPPVEGGTPTVPTSYTGDAMGIPAQSDEIAWAKEFLAFMMSDEIQQSALVERQGLLPIVNSLDDDALTSLPEQAQALVADSRDNGGRPGWTSVVPGGLGQQFIEPLIQQMFNGSLAPAELAQQQEDNLAAYRE